jgi:ABC-type antimicrobial peptide transport system permease subunit
VRSAGDPASLASVVRNEIKAVNRNHTVSEVQTLRQRMVDATARDRFATQVLTTFAVTALLLAAIGIYGVLSLAVAQRRRELGIRMALGAVRGGVLAMILGQALGLAAVGGVIGAVAALIAGRALGSMLYGVAPTDVVAFGTAAALGACAALVASWLPARRAARVDPMIAIRSEEDRGCNSRGDAAVA